MDKDKEFCTCELPIKMIRKTSESFKIWHCATCDKVVDPQSKMILRHVNNVELINPTRNEKILQDKVNELIDLIKANGDML